MSWFWKLFWVLEGGWLLPVSAPCCSSGEPQVRRFHLEAPGALSLHHLHQQRRTSTVEVQLSVRSWASPGSRLGGASVRCGRSKRPLQTDATPTHLFLCAGRRGLQRRSTLLLQLQALLR